MTAGSIVIWAKTIEPLTKHPASANRNRIVLASPFVILATETP
jgi:hypothetical protein